MRLPTRFLPVMLAGALLALGLLLVGSLTDYLLILGLLGLDTRLGVYLVTFTLAALAVGVAWTRRGRRPRIKQPREPLSRRECEVLNLVSAGLGNREIASRLCVSEHTVKTHLKKLFRKLAVENRTAAVARARELNLLD